MVRLSADSAKNGVRQRAQGWPRLPRRRRHQRADLLISIGAD
jgi:hypothetical protein